MKFQTVLIAILLTLPMRVWPSEPSQTADRERIDQERREAESRYLERQRDCSSRFVVTSCMDEAKRERRETLEALRRRQMSLDETARRTRAAERLEEIRGKRDNVDRRAAASAAARSASGEKQLLEPPASLPEVRAFPEPVVPPATRQPVRRDGARAASAAQRVERFHKRQAEAAAHRALVEQRNASQAATGKPVAPLPVPAASVSPRREKPPGR